MTTPEALKPDDKIAIISPSSPVKEGYIEKTVGILLSRGYRPVVMPHAKGPACGTYAASDADRLLDLTGALRDPEIRAILCSRGGYGANHLVDKIEPALITSDPKWLIGYSDISALHALWQANGVVSMHAPMAKHLAETEGTDLYSEYIFTMLEGAREMVYSGPTHPLSHCGKGSGILAGGNLAVINGLAATPFDPMRISPLILFIEDISEQIYAVERMLIRLRLSGLFDSLAGLVCGHFTEYRPNANHREMEQMIAEVTSGYAFPRWLGFEAGHIPENLPLPLGAKAELEITPERSRLSLSL